LAAGSGLDRCESQGSEVLREAQFGFEVRARRIHRCATFGNTVNKPSRSSDVRAYARTTQVRLIAGALILLFTVGLGLIWLFYGPGAAVRGFLCLLGALLPIVLIAIGLWIVDAMVRRGRGGSDS
jgi:hypothetical protein